MGTIVNAIAIIVGSLLGLLFHARMPEKFRTIAFQGLGLITIAIGVALSLRSDNLILAVVSVVFGGILGEALNLESRLENGAENLKKRLGARDNRFTEGFVTASMMFCVGSMTILGALEDGMGHGRNLLYTKSVMDGITSTALAASFGIGTLFSAIPVVVYQGGITIFASSLSHVMSEAMTADLTCVGGILLLGLALNILGIKKISVVNMLPSLVIILPLSYFFG